MAKGKSTQFSRSPPKLRESCLGFPVPVPFWGNTISLFLFTFLILNSGSRSFLPGTSGNSRSQIFWNGNAGFSRYQTAEKLFLYFLFLSQTAGMLFYFPFLILNTGSFFFLISHNLKILQEMDKWFLNMHERLCCTQFEERGRYIRRYTYINTKQ